MAVNSKRVASIIRSLCFDDPKLRCGAPRFRCGSTVSDSIKPTANPAFLVGNLAMVRGLESKVVVPSKQPDGIAVKQAEAAITSKQPETVAAAIKPAGNRAFLVDTLALVRGLEANGVPSKQAEAITAAITEVLNDSLENVAHSFVSKAEMQKSEMIQESNFSKFKYRMQDSQEHNFSMLQRETEKLRGDIEKMRSELRYEIKKVIAGQRLDLNLEKGHIRDELAEQNAETSNLTNKLDREIHALRALLEAGKYDVMKYCIGTLVSISAVGLALVRILL